MAAARTYVDFVPSHELVEDAAKQTLVVNLPGFKKEHLRVQIDNYGRLRDDPKAAADHEAEAARHAAAAAVAEEKQRQEEMEEERARKRHAADEEDRASDEGEDAHHQAASAGRQAYGFARDRRRGGMVRSLLLGVAVALVGVAGLYARYRWMDPSAEAAPADGATVGLSDY
uniref:SHSP domain-containing protein n=1 Tax=Aegilops tauschii TaxID=37682 RepID=N1QZ31_AEGTA